MSWDDWVGGIATGGLYNLGKAGYQGKLGLGGDKFSSAEYNRSNALNQNDPALAFAEANAKKAKAEVGGEAVGSYATNYGNSQVSHVNPTQSNLERITERRRNYYLGGTADYANNAAQNAENTGRYYAGKQQQLAYDQAERGNQVFGRTYGPEGPSAAQAVLRQGTNEAIGSQLALARSGRGMGESASALGAAQHNAVGLQATAANNAAVLRAQEAENYAQRKDAFQRANDQAALGYSTLAQGGIQNAGQQALAGQQLGLGYQTAGTQANQGYENNLLQYYNIAKGGNLAQQQMDRQDQAAYLAAFASLAAASDERMKKDVYKLSPVEAKQDIQPLSNDGKPPAWLVNYMNGQGASSRGDFSKVKGGASGSFDPLSPAEESRANEQDRFGGAEGYKTPELGQPAPARNFKPLPRSYSQYQPTDFAKSLSGNPNAADNAGIVQPWAGRETETDPWAKYLADRSRREDEQRQSEQEDKAQRMGMSAASTTVGLGGLLALLAGGGKLSDEHSKTKISSLQAENDALKQALGGATGGAGSEAARLGYGRADLPRAAKESDVRAQERAYEDENVGYATSRRPATAEDDAAAAIRAAPGYSYNYKNPAAPGAAPGRHFGPMAQDLEKTPAGASTIVPGPGGMKMVDTGRLSLVNTAALHSLQEQVDAMQMQNAAEAAAKAAGSAASSRAGGEVGKLGRAAQADPDYGLPEDQRRHARLDKMPYEGQTPAGSIYQTLLVPKEWPQDPKAIVPRGYGAESGQPVWKARTNRYLRRMAAEMGMSDTQHVYPQTVRDMFPEGSAGQRMSDDEVMKLWRDAWAEPM